MHLRRYEGTRRKPWGFVCSTLFVSFVSFALAPPAVPEASLSAPASQQPAARSGAVRGRVAIGHVVASGGRRPGIADLGAPPDRDAADRQRSVVYLESAPRAAFDQSEPSRAAMDQRNETFVPHVLAITAGSVVDFPNSDRFYHNVFSLSKAARFDLGRYAVGKSKSVRFSQPGIVRVFCEIHSHMNAFVLVFGHPFFAMTDNDGRYRINNVPAGTYNVIAWNEGVASEPKPVTIASGGLAELDFALR